MWTFTTYEMSSFDDIIENVVIWWQLLNVVKNDIILWEWIVSFPHLLYLLVWRNNNTIIVGWWGVGRREGVYVCVCSSPSGELSLCQDTGYQPTGQCSQSTWVLAVLTLQNKWNPSFTFNVKKNPGLCPSPHHQHHLVPHLLGSWAGLTKTCAG